MRALCAAALALALTACSPTNPNIPVVHDLVAELPAAELHREVGTIDFGTAAARPFLAKGWYQNEGGGRHGPTVVWSQGEKSALDFWLAAPRALRAEIRCAPFEPPDGLPQVVTLELNGRRIGEISLRPKLNGYAIDLPRDAQTAGPNRLEFRYRRVTRAQHRQLAVSWDLLRLVPSPAVPAELPRAEARNAPGDRPGGRRTREAPGDVAARYGSTHAGASRTRRAPRPPRAARRAGRRRIDRRARPPRPGAALPQGHPERPDRRPRRPGAAERHHLPGGHPAGRSRRRPPQRSFPHPAPRRLRPRGHRLREHRGSGALDEAVRHLDLHRPGTAHAWRAAHPRQAAAGGGHRGRAAPRRRLSDGRLQHQLARQPRHRPGPGLRLLRFFTERDGLGPPQPARGPLARRKARISLLPLRPRPRSARPVRAAPGVPRAIRTGRPSRRGHQPGAAADLQSGRRGAPPADRRAPAPLRRRGRLQRPQLRSLPGRPAPARPLRELIDPLRLRPWRGIQRARRPRARQQPLRRDPARAPDREVAAPAPGPESPLARATRRPPPHPPASRRPPAAPRPAGNRPGARRRLRRGPGSPLRARRPLAPEP